MWFFSKNHYTCELCHKAQSDGFVKIECHGIESVAKCPRDRVPRLANENRPFTRLLLRMLPGLCRGDGSFDYGAVDSVFRIYRVPKGQRPVLMDRVRICIEALLELRAQERKEQSA